MQTSSFAIQNLSKNLQKPPLKRIDKREAAWQHESMANAKHVGVAVAALDQTVVAVMATGSTWTGGIGGMQGVLVGVAKANVTGLIRLGTLVVAGSHGESTKAGWMKMGPWVGLVVPDMVGVFDIVPSGFDLMRERNSLALPVTSLVVGVVALWGASRVV